MTALHAGPVFYRLCLSTLSDCKAAHEHAMLATQQQLLHLLCCKPLEVFSQLL